MSADTGQRDGWRIIATDDDATLVQTLRDAGHSIFAAYDGRSTYELVAFLPDIDLLITNTRLGAVDSLELMQWTRGLRPKMPILHVVHSGDPDHSVPRDVVTLREPFTPNQLLVVVERLMA